MAEKIVIIDYGSGNLRSVEKAFQRVVQDQNHDAVIEVSARAVDIKTADRIVLPGVGAFAACMEGLSADPETIPALEQAVLVNSKPFLGICVGMQLLATRGLEFVETPGLGWIAGDICRLEGRPSRAVPHMGWNTIRTTRVHSVLDKQLDDQDFYFVHSFHFDVENEQHKLAVCDYGEEVTAAVAHDNIVGVQFHPEKSQKVGLALINRFLRWYP